MRDNVISIKNYKKTKRWGNIPIFARFSIGISIVIAFLIGAGLIYLFINPPEMKWFGRVISVFIFGVLVFHFIKIFKIIKNAKIKESVDYFSFYLTLVCVLSTLTLAFSIVGEGTFKIRIFFLLPSLMLLTLNILTLVKVMKKAWQ